MEATPHTASETGLEDIIEVAQRVVKEAEQADVLMRLIGGVAVVVHSADQLEPALRRTPEDVDVVVHRSAKAKLDSVFARVGFAPDRHFNALNGADRRIYYSESGVKADVFVGAFRMCHVVPFDEKRLALDYPTAPLAELLLTKAQVVQLTRKDATDLVALLRDHDVGDHDDGVVNAAWIGGLCGHDWGLWRTVSETLRRVTTFVHEVEVDVPVRERVRSRLEHLLTELERAPKSHRWKMRSRIGDRITWYELPEDPTRGTEV